MSLPSLRADKDGALRVIAHPVSFEHFMDRSVGALLQYCAADMATSLRLLDVLGEVSLSCDDAERLSCVALFADRLEEITQARLVGFNLERLKERADRLRRALASPDYRRCLRDSTARFGGTA